MLASTAAQADQCGPVRGRTGNFDYYLLSLSWSPSYCATTSGKQNPRQCGAEQRYGMVVHGLWPQHSDGTWPQCCQPVSAVKSSAATSQASKVMIGSSLLQHEWSKHGSCVTDQQDLYFGKINSAVSSLGLAPNLPGSRLERIKVSDLKRNWAVPADAITVHCKGKRLSEVHICLDKALAPIACPAAEVKNDNCPGTVRLD
ncbi:Ribonuclease T2 family protein [Paramagnetospirillum magnetotacticum MS-1]|uniref:Ribonuclease T2 family protein n=2 Tax=Paramagnetospirillum magnetotacticum TaxID=188 RepID=A0A0C2V0P4_PARME|nr:Ribonuclease T2 family protein [Paramagnetospirillum magnetotacticum MS-1]